jgi:hypothetical protein
MFVLNDGYNIHNNLTEMPGENANSKWVYSYSMTLTELHHAFQIVKEL